MLKDTKTHIMDVAEALFAKQGFKACSLRTITQEAGVNLAAVNYHFGSKERLLEAIYARRINPMNAERLQRLHQLRADHGEASIPITALARAFVEPALRLSREAKQQQFIRLLGRCYLEPSLGVQRNIRALFDEVVNNFKDAFAASLPELSREELYWRLHFMVGVLAYCMAGTDMMRVIASSHLSDGHDTETLIDRLVGFICHGLSGEINAVHAGAARREEGYTDASVHETSPRRLNS
ncbi:MAG: TetR/AcrR family transcriptional regulator [Thiotrichales bacterium]